MPDLNTFICILAFVFVLTFFYLVFGGDDVRR